MHVDQTIGLKMAVVKATRAYSLNSIKSTERVTYRCPSYCSSILLGNARSVRGPQAPSLPALLGYRSLPCPPLLGNTSTNQSGNQGKLPGVVPYRKKRLIERVSK